MKPVKLLHYFGQQLGHHRVLMCPQQVYSRFYYFALQLIVQDLHQQTNLRFEGVLRLHSYILQDYAWPSYKIHLRLEDSLQIQVVKYVQVLLYLAFVPAFVVLNIQPVVYSVHLKVNNRPALRLSHQD